MAKKKRKLSGGLGQKETQVLHLKEFSQGKPNELSLNVLEQKAAAHSEKPKKSFGLPIGGFGAKNKKAGGERADAPTASTTAAATPATPASPNQSGGSSFLGSDSHAEIQRRQQRRKTYRRVSIAIVAVICVCLIGVGGYWAYQQYERLSTSIGLTKEACSYIEKSDEVVVAIDEYFQTEFGDGTIDTATQLIADIDTANTALDKAKDYATQARDNLEGSSRDKEAAERALSTIDARASMLSIAEERLNDDIAAKKALDAMDGAQAAIDSGNALMVRAAQVVSDTTEDNVNDSTKYTTSAQESFTEAKNKVSSAQECYPEADLSTLASYLDARLTAASEALLSNAAILLQDRQTAESHNDAYNAADTEATQLAADLDSNITQPIIDAYSSNEEALESAYNEARSSAAANDAFLRDYLGN